MEPLISGLSNPANESARSSSFSLYLEVDVRSTYTITHWTLACLVEDFDPRCEEANNHERAIREAGQSQCGLGTERMYCCPRRRTSLVPAAFGPAPRCWRSRAPGSGPVRSFWMHRGIPCSARFHAPAHSGSFITRSFQEITNNYLI